MLLALIKRQIMWIFDCILSPSVEETALLDDQDLTPPPEMPQHPSYDHTGASGDNWKVSKNGRHEGRSRPVSGTDAYRHRGEHRSSREDRLQSQSARFINLENDYHQLAERFKSLERNHHQLLGNHQISITNLHEAQTTSQRQQQEIDALKGRLLDTSALLDVRNYELKVAKAFLSNEDRVSTSDVAQSVRDLNSEIMQTATYLVEALPLKRFHTPSAWEVLEGPCKSIFVALVLPRGSGEGVDEALLELALQGFLTSYASHIANMWGFSCESGGYDELYLKVCETEDHTVASNWRVLTRRTLSHVDSSRKDLLGEIVYWTVNQLAELLSSCGVGNPVDNTNNIQRYGSEKLKALFTAARNLNRMIGENFVSEDLIVSVIPGGTMFDGEHMEDARARAGSKPDQRTVICTTDMGLWERKQTKGIRKPLLKPKVVLFNS